MDVIVDWGLLVLYMNMNLFTIIVLVEFCNY
jgi:hypothetical protein